jgi:hypothetical protein
MKRTRALALVAAGACLGAAGLGVAQATIPDPGGVFHGCALKSGRKVGLLRVIDTDQGQACKPTENAVQWNQTGPPGPSGVVGVSTAQTGSVAAGGYTFEVACPGGATPIAAGWHTVSGPSATLLDSYSSRPGVWRIDFTVPNTANLELQITCANVPASGSAAARSTLSRRS